MRATDITAVALKFFAIYMLMQIVLYAPSFFSFEMNLSASTIGADVILVLLGFMGLALFVAVYLFRLANSISDRMRDNDDVKSDLDQKQLLQLLGIYLVVDGSFGMPVLGMILLEEVTTDIGDALYFLGEILRIIIGVSCLTSSAFWMNFLRKLRS